MSGAPALFAPPAYPDDFEELWQAFRKPVHKHAAFLEHRRLKKAGQLPSHQELMTVIAAQHQSERWQAGVQPDFRTWLHQSRWQDDPAQMTWRTNGNGHRPPLPSPRCACPCACNIPVRVEGNVCRRCGGGEHLCSCECPCEAVVPVAGALCPVCAEGAHG